jgi:hypothetical protein
MALATSVDDAAARRALGEVSTRLVELIRTMPRPDAPALGEWNAEQVAQHLAHVWEVLPRLARRQIDSWLDHPADLEPFTSALVKADQNPRDPATSAARIRTAADAYLAAPVEDAAPRPWMFAGIQLPAAAFTCHLLNESLVHGHDIARSQGLRWRIEPAHAALAIRGFLLASLQAVDPRFPVDQEHAAGVHACYDVRIRGCARFHLLFEDGAVAVEPPSARRVDWHVSADPTTFFLVVWSRITPWRPLLTGRLRGWGRRPSLGPRLTRMMKNP